LDDAAATEFEKAVRNAITWDGNSDTRTRPEAQGDALFDIAAFYNKNHNRRGTARHLPHISLSADLSTLNADLPQATNDDDQHLVSPACTDTYLCDCFIHVILREADGAPASFGRARYTVPRKLFRQIAARDGGCRFPGCNRHVRYTEAHHIIWWRPPHYGTTDYWNLVLLCSRHHHIVHQQRLDLKLLPNGQLDVTWRDGRQRSSQPRGAPPQWKPPV
ncbi:MAG: HNH endonuclease, partial [Actinomycetia bacterium]|nr:HNH endonuclease [Actinomycetes bacterium]